MKSSTKPLLIAVIGATATGKTNLALQIAKKITGEIINCDSMQLVKGMDIGTAKPSLIDRATTPHHLYDLIDPNQWYSAGQYMVEARAICREIADRDKVSLVVGGTGLYLKALLQGIFEGPSRSTKYRRHLNKVVDQGGNSQLYAQLLKVDPISAKKIPVKDKVRIIRALEVYYESGSPISKLQLKRIPLNGFRVIKIGIHLDREDLYDRINKRVHSMFETGLLREVRELMDQGYSIDCKGFEAIGYRQAISFLLGNISLEEAIEKTSIDTRHYAKRQVTWFRREPGVNWVQAPGESSEALTEALKLLVNTNNVLHCQSIQN